MEFRLYYLQSEWVAWGLLFSAFVIVYLAYVVIKKKVKVS